MKCSSVDNTTTIVLILGLSLHLVTLRIFNSIACVQTGASARKDTSTSVESADCCCVPGGGGGDVDLG